MSLDEENLADIHYVTVLLRLGIDSRGQVQGEVVGVTIAAQTRFAGWRGLVRAVRDLALDQLRERAPNDP
jgi:hypothetical protein